MVTAVDHIANLRSQLLEKQRGKEREVEEIKDLIRALDEAPRMLKGEPPRDRQEQRRETVTGSTKQNLTFSKDVADYVAGYKWDEAISITEMLKTLAEEKGIQGKHKSLYVHASNILKKLAEKHMFGLRHKTGFGYYREREKSVTDRNDSELVASR